VGIDEEACEAIHIGVVGEEDWVVSRVGIIGLENNYKTGQQQ
jgi:hypothetical protein